MASLRRQQKAFPHLLPPLMFSLNLLLLLASAVHCTTTTTNVFTEINNNNRVFFKRMDMHVPLNPVIWGRMQNDVRMLIGVNHKGDPAKIQAALGNVYLMDRRGIMKYEEIIVSRFDHTAIDPSKDVMQQISAVDSTMGPALDCPLVDKFVILPGAKASDFALVPPEYWKSLNRDQFAKLVAVHGLVPLLNHYKAIKSLDYVGSLAWSPSLGSLLRINDQPLISHPRAIRLGEASLELMRKFGDNLIYGEMSQDPMRFFLELDGAGMATAVRFISGRMESDRRSIELTLLHLLRNSKAFADLPDFFKVREELPDDLCELDITGEQRLKAFILLLCDECPVDQRDGASSKLAARYVVHIQETRGDLEALQFLAQLKGLVPPVDSVMWDFQRFGQAHWDLVGKLQVNSAFVDLFVTGFLLDQTLMPEVNIGPRHLMESFRKKKTLKEKLARSFLRDNLHLTLKSLVALVDANPADVALPSALLKAIAEHKTSDQSLQIALLAHAYRQNATRSEWMKDESKTHISQAPLGSSLFDRMNADRLKAFLSAGQPDVMTYLMKDRSRLVDLAKSTLSEEQGIPVTREVFREIYHLVLSDKFDINDSELLVEILASNYRHIRFDILRQIQRKLLVIDALCRQTPEPLNMHRLSQVIDLREESSGADMRLTLERIGAEFVSEYKTAEFIQLDPAHPDAKIRLTTAQVVDAFIWQSPGHQLVCAGLVHILSYYYSKLTLADEVIGSISWVIDGLDTADTLNLLNRVYQRDEITNLLHARLGKLGFELQFPSNPNILSPVQTVLMHQDNQAGLQAMLVAYERTPQAKAGWMPMDCSAVLDRIFELASPTNKAMRRDLFDQAYVLAGTFESAFKLLSLARGFDNLALTVMWSILQANEMSVNKAASSIRKSIDKP